VRTGPLVTALLAWLAVAAVPAAAQSPVSGLRAHGPWVSFERDGHRVLDQRGALSAFPTVGERLDLAADARGRGVGVYAACDGRSDPAERTCAIRERRLTTGRTRTLLAKRRGITAVGHDRGLLALAIWAGDGEAPGDGGELSKIVIRRPGESKLRTIRHRQRATRLEVGGGFVMFFDETSPTQQRVGVIDVRGAKPKLVFTTASREPCKCTSTSTIFDATLDGRHVYWTEVAYYSPDGLGTGNANYETFRRIRRVDFRAPGRVVEEHRTQNEARSIAVADGVLYHDADEAYAEGRRPSWQAVPEFP
jgi:hypothetical protein